MRILHVNRTLWMSAIARQNQLLYSISFAHWWKYRLHENHKMQHRFPINPVKKISDLYIPQRSFVHLPYHHTRTHLISTCAQHSESLLHTNISANGGGLGVVMVQGFRRTHTFENVFERPSLCVRWLLYAFGSLSVGVLVHLVLSKAALVMGFECVKQNRKITIYHSSQVTRGGV